MKLYHLTSIPSSAITATVHGSFTAPKQQELITASSSAIELFRLLPKKSRLVPIIRLNTFSQIRAVAVFRLPATKRDYILLTSDAGSLTILSADESSASFRTVHCESFGKTGARRCVPAQYIACDPRGRACMIAAIEKTKFSFILNRDAQQNLTISSPLEAHKSNTATFSLVALDAGFENPVFAALERSYEAESKKHLVFYELDFGLNHVARKYSCSVHDSSFLTFPVPGHTDGPGGLLICSSQFVTYKPYPLDDSSLTLEARIPYRSTAGDPSQDDGEEQDQDTLVVSGTLYQDKKRKAFFFILCTENGDLIKVDLESNAESRANKLKLAYFDTLPAPATSMCIFRSGYLHAALEGSDAILLRFKEVNVRDDDPAGGISIATASPSSERPPNGTNAETTVANGNSTHPDGEGSEGLDAVRNSSRLQFHIRTEMKNIAIMERHESLAPLLSLSCSRGVDDQHLFVGASGFSQNGKLNVFRRGIAVSELSDPFMFPSTIQGVFTLKRADSQHHFYIVVSLYDRTKLLQVTDGQVEETYGTGIKLDAVTLLAANMAGSSQVQIWRGGVRFMPNENPADVTEWLPNACQILTGCCNAHQVVVALSSGDIVRFEVDRETGALVEVESISKAFESQVTPFGCPRPSLAIPSLGRGRTRSSFFAFADGASNRVRLYRINNDNVSTPLGLHLAPAPVASLTLVDFANVDGKAMAGLVGGNLDTNDRPLMNILIGTNNGALLRISIDHLTGSMARKKTYFLGAHPVRTATIRVTGMPICLGLGTQPLVLYRQGGRVIPSPLCSSAIEYASEFSSIQASEGFVVSSGPRLLLLALEVPEALTASALLPPNTPTPSVPCTTMLRSSFRTANMHLSGTVRRVFALTTKDAAESDPHGNVSDSGREGKLYVLFENDHRREFIPILDKPHSSNGVQISPEVAQNEGSIRKSPAGTWFSRIALYSVHTRLLKAGTSMPATETDKPLVSCIDSKMFEGSSRCILDATELQTVEMPGSEGVALAIVTISYVDNLYISATSRSTKRGSKNTGTSVRPIHAGLITYLVSKEAKKLVQLHDTELADPAQVIVPFRDMLLVGMGRTLRLYRLGRKKLLKRTEFNFAVQNKIVSLAVAGSDRIFVGDVQESVTLFAYVISSSGSQGVHSSGRQQVEGGKFVPIASDKIPRWIVTLQTLDYSSVCGSDKFGNIFVLRLPQELNKPASHSAISGMGSGALVAGSRAVNHRLVTEAHFYIGSIVVGISLLPSSTLVNGEGRSEDSAKQCIVYNTIDGTVGTITPLRNRADASFAQSLEREMRSRYKSVCGRDHISYRSSFQPVKNVVDGDLCHMFSCLAQVDKTSCADAVGRTADDIEWKLDELRALAF